MQVKWVIRLLMNTVLASWLLISTGWAEPAGVTTSTNPVDEDVKAPVLVEQATLHYPDAAYADQLHGTVTLRVHISDSGTVETAC